MARGQPNYGLSEDNKSRPLQTRARGDDQKVGRYIERLGFIRNAKEIVSYSAIGSSGSSGVTEIELSVAGATRLPVTTQMCVERVAISWLSDNVPAGSWELKMFRRQPHEADFLEVATFSVTTS